MKKIEVLDTFSDVSPLHTMPFSYVLIDLDGVLGPHRGDIPESSKEHLNMLEEESPNSEFKIVTNGLSRSIEGIETVRTRPPLIKQFPGVLRSVTDDPRSTLVLTDSPTETLASYLSGIETIYIKNSFRPHPAESVFRLMLRPVRKPVYRLLDLETS
jgi:hypothetical protein